MYSKERGIPGLISSIHDLTLDTSNIEKVQQDFCQATGALGVHLLLFDENNKPLENMAYSAIGKEFAEEVAREYTQYYNQFDLDRVERYFSLSQRKAVSNHQLTTPEEKRSSPLYNEYFPKFDSEEQLIIGCESSQTKKIVISQARPREHGDYQNDELKKFEYLSFHLFQAFRVRERIIKRCHISTDIADMMTDSSAIMMIGPNRKICWMNKAAKELDSGLSTICISSRKVLFGNFKQRASLERLIDQAILLSTRDKHRVGTLVAELGLEKYIIDVFSVQRESLIAANGKGCALLSIRKPNALPVPSSELVQSYFGLTPAESRLALAIANEIPIKEYAAHTGLTESTVRSTMKLVLSKVGVSRQTDLALRIVSLSPQSMR